MARDTTIALGILWLLAADVSTARAQSTELETIRVEAVRRTPDLVEHAHSLPADTSLGAVNLEFALRSLPGAQFQTNSRGETELFFRASGNRQTAFFLDGALVNVPWDFKADLSVIPVGAAARPTLIEGASTVVHGINTSGSVIDLSRGADAAPSGIALQGLVGEGDLYSLRGDLDQQFGDTRVATTLQHSDRNFVTLPGGADLPFSQATNNRRTNSDRKQGTGIFKLDHQVGERVSVGGTALYSHVDKGVSPESHLDPLVESVRFWRLPDTETGLFTLRGKIEEPNEWAISTAVWVGTQHQEIESYSDVTYTDLEEIEDSRDVTLGSNTRLALGVGELGTFDLTLIAYTSRHRERELDVAGGSILDPDIDFTRFRQNVTSLGGRYVFEPSHNFSIRLGLGYDRLGMPVTGGRESSGAFTATNYHLNARYDIGEKWYVTALAARKVRFPTLRELFGVALNRFLINPDLKAEETRTYDVSTGHSARWGGFKLSLFYQDISDAIDQQDVIVDGERRRQRINLPGSRAYGLMGSFTAQLSRSISLKGHLTQMNLDRRLGRELTERPERIAGLTLAWMEGPFTARAELDHVGPRVFRNDGEIERIGATTLVHLFGSYEIGSLGGALPSELFLQARNVGDTARFFQLGLPEAGRTILGGMTARF